MPFPSTQDSRALLGFEPSPVPILYQSAAKPCSAISHCFVGLRIPLPSTRNPLPSQLRPPSLDGYPSPTRGSRPCQLLKLTHHRHFAVRRRNSELSGGGWSSDLPHRVRRAASPLRGLCASSGQDWPNGIP